MKFDIDPWQQIDQLIALALAEDVGPGDATTLALAPQESTLSANFTAREDGVVSGTKVLEHLFRQIDPQVKLTTLKNDGETFTKGNKLVHISGPARSVLTGERLALNIFQHMCGVARETRKYVELTKHTNAGIYDTRKTKPGHRAIEKMAVVDGGGNNHRQGLYDMVLIKDNHLALAHIPDTAAAVRIARENCDLEIMVEVDTLKQLEEVLPEEPDYVLLDNMGPDMLRQAVEMCDSFSAKENKKRPKLEASGGINLNTVKAIAESGIDRISVGAITHSAPALDIGLDYAG